MTGPGTRYQHGALMALLLLLCSAVCGARAAEDVYVPAELEPWRQWVLERHPDRDCPHLPSGSARRCVFSTALELDASEAGAAFTLDVEVHAERQQVVLPGSTDHWPVGVRSGGRTRTVLPASGDGRRPALVLGPGRHRIEGRIPWPALPDRLSLPEDLALLTVTVDGRRLERPNQRRGVLLFAERQAAREADVQDSVDVRVFRLLVDGVPLRQETLLQLFVSGRERELQLGRALTRDFVLTALDSELPARIEDDGSLRVQARAGSWEIRLAARHPGDPSELAAERSTDNWPEEEIWSFAADRTLRAVTLDGPSQLDPQQTGMPQAWRRYPAYLVTPATPLALTEVQRGDVNPAPNELVLSRTAWLDFDGRGYTFQDQLVGRINQRTRISAAADFAVGRIDLDGEAQLVTGGDALPVGIEVDPGDFELLAVGRVEGRGSFPSVGWSEDVARLDVQLNLPSAWEVLTASGVDVARGTWVSRWSLWGVFLVLVITVGTFRLLGPRWAAVALAALVVSHDMGSAPLWIWANLLLVIAAVERLPEGVPRTLLASYTRLSQVALVLIVIAFAVEQLRIAVYPQLAQQGVAVGSAGAGRHRDAPPPPPDAIAYEAAEGRMIEEVIVTSSRMERPSRRALPVYQEGASIQTGPGVPRWHWRSLGLAWGGLVTADQRTTLVLLPPWLTRSFRVLAVLLAAALAVGFVMRTPATASGVPSLWNWLRGTPALLLLLVFAAPEPARADAAVDPELLRELEQRLTRPPACLPRCASIERVRASLSGEALTLHLDVAVGSHVSVPLIASRGWSPSSARAAGGPLALRRSEDTLAARLQPGRHELELQGPLAGLEQVSITFPLPVARVEAEADGWRTYGAADGRLLGNSLQFERLEPRADATEAAPSLLPDPVAPFVIISRSIDFDVEWEMSTHVERVAPAAGALSLTVPLLQGESVLSEEVETGPEGVSFSLRPDQQETEWVSRLERNSPLRLTAGDADRWVERWIVSADNRWHLEYEGLAPIKLDRGEGGLRWHPRPGEALTLELTRPVPVPGDSMTIESARLVYRPSMRVSDADLELTIRSSQGGEHPVTLPPGAVLTALATDGREQPIRETQGAITLSLTPGEHRHRLAFRMNEPVALRTASPAVDLGAPATNVEIVVEPPPGRWPLLVGGPAIGPAMLYWGVLLVVVVMALLLGRTRVAPLGTRDWLLLGIGMSLANLTGLLVAVAWFLLMAARRDFAANDQERGRFNLMQVGLAGYSLLALAFVIYTVPLGLVLGDPEMQIIGNGSGSGSLRWYQDQIDGALPRPWLLSTSIWIYRLAMLLWSLWLAFGLVRWIAFGWTCFTTGGIWRARPTIATGDKSRPVDAPEPPSA